MESKQAKKQTTKPQVNKQTNKQKDSKAWDNTLIIPSRWECVGKKLVIFHVYIYIWFNRNKIIKF